MSRFTVSSCHSLELIPVRLISRFARHASVVSMLVAGEPVEPNAVPGSIKVSSSYDKGVLKKKITFERSDVSPFSASVLERLKGSRLVAVYVDEAGCRRVAGSPSWPLSLDYVSEGGVFVVTLEGEDVLIDGFLEV